MKLKPYIEEDENETLDPITRATNEALSITGLKKGKSGKLELDEIRNIFEENNCGIKDVAVNVGSLMRSNKEEVSLRASELALKVQGVFKEMDGNNVPEIHISVNGNGNQTLIELVCPS